MNYLNYRISTPKASNGAFLVNVTSKVDGRVLTGEPAETKDRAVFVGMMLADRDMMEAIEAVNRGERF